MPTTPTEPATPQPVSTPDVPGDRPPPRTPEYYAGERERRRRRTSRLQAVLRSLPVLAVLLVLLAAMVVGGVRRPDPGEAWREAESVVWRELAPGERMLVGTRVLRRHWGDHFRATHGVFVATDRRLLYAGVLPPPLLGPVAAPALVEQMTFPFDSSLVVTASGGGRRAEVSYRGMGASFALAPEALERLEAIRTVADRSRAIALATLTRERFLHDSVAALPPPPAQVHVVAPGETIIGLGIRYGYTPDSLMERNGLTTDRIRAGQRLVVREFRRVDGVVQGY